MKSENPLLPFLNEKGVLILDGGLATELEARGHDLSDELWSARLLIDDPEAIKQVHLDYLKSGADCIISASYQGTISGFMKRGLTAQEAEQLLLSSIQLAVDARDSYWEKPGNRGGRLRPLVAASIGPYGAALANGSEYRGNYGLDEDELLHFHWRRWQILGESEADILACETIPSFPECRALARLLTETPVRYAWFSFSCRDGEHIHDGTPMAKCASWLDRFDQVAAVGINCTSPQYIPSLIKEVAQVTDKPIVVYPNSGEQYDVEQKRWLGIADSTDFAKASEDWCAEGAKLIGGCCRTGPEHIRRIRAALIR